MAKACEVLFNEDRESLQCSTVSCRATASWLCGVNGVIYMFIVSEILPEKRVEHELGDGRNLRRPVPSVRAVHQDRLAVLN